MRNINEIGKEFIGVALRLSELSENKIPKGDDYTRKFSLNPVVKKKVATLNAQLNQVIAKTLQLHDSTATLTTTPAEPSKAPTGEVAIAPLLSAIDLCLRKADRGKQLCKRRRPSIEGGEPTEDTTSLRDLLTQSGEDQADELKRQRLSSARQSTATSKDSKKFYIRRKDNFAWLFVPSLIEKPHALEPLQDDLVNAQRGRKSDQGLFSRLPLSGDSSTDVNALASYIKTSEKILGAGGKRIRSQVRTNSPEEESCNALDLRHHARPRPDGDKEGDKEDDKEGDKEDDSSMSEEECAGPGVTLEHPYEKELSEITRLWKGDDVWDYGIDGLMHRKLFETAPPCEVKETAVDKIVFVDTDAALSSMIDEILEGHDEIAVDVEWHSRNSYRGYVCLIQISTCAKDYVVDPSVVNLLRLNEIFTCPSVLKIMHGCDRDVVWLQEDHSLYLVNVFDTHQAAIALATPGGHSLSNLVSFYCRQIISKKEQQSDWRRRPLTKSQLYYAATDTHYLLYIFQAMRNQLITKSTENAAEVIPVYSRRKVVTSRGKTLMHRVLENSRQLCRQTVTYAPPDFRKLVQRPAFKGLPPHDGQVLVHLLAWRDLEARRHDCMPALIMPDQLLRSIIETKPRNSDELRSILSKTSVKAVYSVSSFLSLLTSLCSKFLPNPFGDSTQVKPESNNHTMGTRADATEKKTEQKQSKKKAKTNSEPTTPVKTKRAKIETTVKNESGSPQCEATPDSLRRKTTKRGDVAKRADTPTRGDTGKREETGRRGDTGRRRDTGRRGDGSNWRLKGDGSIHGTKSRLEHGEAEVVVKGAYVVKENQRKKLLIKFSKRYKPAE